MIDIDRRKNYYQTSHQLFPNITHVQRKDQENIKKEN
jgi:hypothetical protein